MRKRVLIIEDDAGIARLLLDNLTIDGFDVRCAHDAHDGLVACQEFLPDLVLLDVMLPDRIGFDLVGLLRQGGRRSVIVLSARGSKADKVDGLTRGADDYVTKPFDIEELVARIHAVLRHTQPAANVARIGRIEFDFEQHQATGPSGQVHFTAREFEILRYLAAHHH
ncbi:MAG TPA: response regulator transcription factor, partial [Thermomicrobiales bacterium]|nr:response regulator transcription factor [Thermomicrobiales bacterium]